MSRSELSADDMTPRVWIVLSFLTVTGLSALTAILSNWFTFLTLGLWALILVMMLVLLVRPKPIEVLFFLLPLVFPALPALSGLSSIAFTSFWLVIMLCIWYVHGCMNGWTEKCIEVKFLVPFALYAILVILSIWATEVRSISLSNLSQCTALVLIYWLFVQVLTGRDLRRILHAVIIGTAAGTLIYLVAISRIMSHLSFSALAVSALRPTVLDYNPNSWAVYPLIGLPLALAMIFHGKPNFRRLLWLIPVASLLSFVAFLNLSRSALLAIGLSSIFILFSHQRGRRILMVGGLPAAFFFLLFMPAITAYFEPMLRLQAGLSGREELWPLAWNLILDHPVLGLGPGGYSEHIFYFVSFTTNSVLKIVNLLSVHNAFLQIGVDIGIIGPLLILLIYVIFAVRSRTLWRQLKSSPSFSVLVAICALMIAGFVRSLFEVDFTVLHGYLTDNLILITLLAIQDQLVARS